MHDVPAAVSENIYRILQEALTNVSRHAQTAEVRINLHVSAADFGWRHYSSVMPESASIPAARDDKRLGILGMREQGRVAGRDVRGEPLEPGKGTRVEVVIPIVQPQAA